MSQYDFAFKGETAALRTWLQANKKQVDALSKDRKCTLLYTAVRAGHFECAKMLVDEFGADVNRANGDADVASSPLHAAAFGGFPPCVALLVVRGAKVDAANKLGETPLDNAKSPADGVSAGVKRKCQELLGGDAAAASAAAAMLEVAIKNLAVAAASAGKAAPGAAPAAAAKDDDGDAPPAKAKKTTAGATAVTAVSKPAKPVAPDGVHPLKGKTVVFTGAFAKKKALLEALVHELGGKGTGSVSSKTDILVKGKNSGGKEWEALSRGLPVWTEEQFVAVCEKGASAWPPEPAVPPCLQAFAKSKHLPDETRDVVLRVLIHSLEDTKYGFNVNNIQLAKGVRPSAHEIGFQYLAPYIKEWAGTHVHFWSGGLTDDDVKLLFKALTERSASMPVVGQINLSNNPAIGDQGAIAIAEALPKLQIVTLCLQGATLTAVGINALLKALERSPTIISISLHSITGVAPLAKAWRAGAGKDVKCQIHADVE